MHARDEKNALHVARARQKKLQEFDTILIQVQLRCGA